MTIATIPSPREVPLRIPIDAEGLGRFWSEVQLPRRIAEEWVRDGLDPDVGQRVLRAYDDAEAIRS